MNSKVKENAQYFFDYLWEFVKEWYLWSWGFVIQFFDNLLEILNPDYEWKRYVYWIVMGLGVIVANTKIYIRHRKEIQSLNQEKKGLLSELTIEVPAPKLSLQIFKHDVRPIEYIDAIELQIVAKNWRPSFGLAIVNETEGTVAEGIVATLEVSWSGVDLEKAPKIFVPTDGEGWKANPNTLIGKDTAKYEFRGSERHRIPHGQPLSWEDFSFLLRIGEKNPKGILIISADISCTNTERPNRSVVSIGIK